MLDLQALRLTVRTLDNSVIDQVGLQLQATPTGAAQGNRRRLGH